LMEEIYLNVKKFWNINLNTILLVEVVI